MAEVHNKARNPAQGTKGKAKGGRGPRDWQRQTQSQRARSLRRKHTSRRLVSASRTASGRWPSHGVRTTRSPSGIP